MTFIQSKMTCLSPRTILLQRTSQSNLKFQCKIHERTRGLEERGLEYFDDTTLRAQNPSMFIYNETYSRSWTVKK